LPLTVVSFNFPARLFVAMNDLLNWQFPAVADVDMILAEASPATAGVASLCPPSLSFGKLLGSGGGSGKLVALVAVNRDDTCLGFIGNGKTKICLGSKDCGTKSHERDRFSFPESVQDLVFIDMGGVNPAAWAAPYVELSWFGGTWERYRFETRNGRRFWRPWLQDSHSRSKRWTEWPKSRERRPPVYAL
jgi:hypothetical protein